MKLTLCVPYFYSLYPVQICVLQLFVFFSLRYETRYIQILSVQNQLPEQKRATKALPMQIVVVYQLLFCIKPANPK